MQHLGSIFMGPPGSGKGTQAKMLTEVFSIPHISTGDILRKEVSEGSELGKKVKAIMTAGNYVDDTIMNALVEKRFGQADVEPGYVLDGYPRTPSQAESLLKVLENRGLPEPRVLVFEVPRDLLVGRVVGRLSCPSCGAVYHKVQNPPAQKDICSKCGHRGLEERKDDTEETVVRRLEVFDKETSPLLSFFEKRGRVSRIDGTLKPAEVQARVQAALK